MHVASTKNRYYLHPASPRQQQENERHKEFAKILGETTMSEFVKNNTFIRQLTAEPDDAGPRADTGPAAP